MTKEELRQGQIDAMEEVKAIPLEKVKQAREKMWKNVYEYSGTGDEVLQAYCDGFKASLQIMDKLIEESCEDMVSRKEIQQKINRLWNSNGDKDYCMETLRDFVTELPSVKPIYKKGKWINKSHTSSCGINFVASECTCCGKRTFFDCDQLVYNYCPNCGAYMREVEE